MTKMIDEMNDLEKGEGVVAATFGETKQKKKKSINHKICFWTKGVIALSLVFIVVLGISISINYNSFKDHLGLVGRLHAKSINSMKVFDE